MKDKVLMLKLKIKRIYRFCMKGGVKYISAQGVLKAMKWRLSNSFKSNSVKKLYWIGPFSPIHGNVGDHAQTLGVRRFLQDYFGSYKVITIYRDDITVKLLENIASQLRSSDLIFLQSSGDFGSMHDVGSHHTGSISYPEVRRQIVKHAPTHKVINLPVTAYYQDDEKGRKSLKNDRTIFDRSNFTVLCREQESLRVLKTHLKCKSMFFPDFVFYLKPEPISGKRKGVLAILRSDKEAVLSQQEKAQLVGFLKTTFSDVTVKDVMHEYHVVPEFILENYMEKVFQQFQHRELIVTDKMHGMISAVITGTPCVALSGGIPHKILAYKSFLSGAVEFANDYSDIESAILRLQGRKYQPVDLHEYFKSFRERVLQS